MHKRSPEHEAHAHLSIVQSELQLICELSAKCGRPETGGNLFRLCDRVRASGILLPTGVCVDAPEAKVHIIQISSAGSAKCESFESRKG